LFKFKLLEKEKRQLEVKLDKLDKLSRALQQERSELQTTIKNLSKPGTTTVNSSTENHPSTSVETIPSNGHDVPKNDSVLTTTTDTDGSPNLYGSCDFICINYQ